MGFANKRPILLIPCLSCMIETEFNFNCLSVSPVYKRHSKVVIIVHVGTLAL